MYKNHKIGKIGEDIAAMFLVKRGFSVLKRNYRKKFGEIDIIARKGKKLYFFEVKSVSRVTGKNTELMVQPEESVHLHKQRRLMRTIQTYLLEVFDSTDIDWELDVLAVFVDPLNRLARVKHISNVIL